MKLSDLQRINRNSDKRRPSRTSRLKEWFSIWYERPSYLRPITPADCPDCLGLGYWWWGEGRGSRPCTPCQGSGKRERTSP